MTKIVAAHFWVCEYCELPLYEKQDMEKHLKEEHGIDDREFEYVGSHMVVAEIGFKPIPPTPADPDWLKEEWRKYQDQQENMKVLEP